MAAIAGWKALVKQSGASTAFAAAEPMTDIGISDTPTDPRKRYQITLASRRVLNSTTAITFQSSTDGFVTPVDVVNSGGTAYTLDRLRGIVSFTSAQPANTALRVKAGTGAWLAMATAGEARAYDFTLSAGDLDTTIFGDTYKKRVMGLKEASGTLDMFYVDNSFYTTLNAGTPVILEFYSDTTTRPDMVMRAVLSSRDVSTGVADIVTENVQFDSATGDADNRVISIYTF